MCKEKYFSNRRESFEINPEDKTSNYRHVSKNQKLYTKKLSYKKERMSFVLVCSPKF